MEIRNGDSFGFWKFLHRAPVIWMNQTEMHFIDEKMEDTLSFTHGIFYECGPNLCAWRACQ